MKNFLRITRHAHTSAHVEAIAVALACAPTDLHVVTADAGAYGPDPRDTLRRHIADLAAREGVQWDGVEVTGPGAVLDALGDLGCPRYRAVMARGADGRVAVQLDAQGVPVRGPDGRDVLVIESYIRA